MLQYFTTSFAHIHVCEARTLIKHFHQNYKNKTLQATVVPESFQVLKNLNATQRETVCVPYYEFIKT